jgi:hypothetical protein
MGRLVLRLPRDVRDPLLRHSAQVVAALPGRASHVVVKSIYAIFAADWIAANYQPRVIAIQRHPLNVISSWAEFGVHGFDLLARPHIVDRYLHRLGVAVPGPHATNLQRIATWVGVLSSWSGIPTGCWSPTKTCAPIRRQASVTSASGLG